MVEIGDPFTLFRAWFDDAQQSGLKLPNAMSLATASPNGRPSNRFVLLKGVDDRGFLFYSNYDSRKGNELQVNPWAAAAMYWLSAPPRQVRMEGRVEKLTSSESDAYFHSRSRGSQIGAAASPQSRVIGDREEIESSVEILERELAGKVVPRPTYWGGYRIIPDCIEFWTERNDRLHDRIRYRRQDGEGWIIERLAP